ncbi:ABC transporter permease [Paraconexibacter algicola]|uniref:Transport permease protein n=1 Tax=Paraconexibacter algicola TaxID=2133960 RepID=A0A2T4UL05_9ACTN|nr:ABC transporter permease [Paraconexibacter algicola]PTL59900.1 hypothetical protein C7Y72_09685 [Paraconexibacter algicola]
MISTSELRRIFNLVWTLAVTDFRLRFYGSTLGVLWTLVRPFAFFGVIYFVFTEIAGLDANVENYGVYILFAMVLFNFFAEVTVTSVQCLVERESLLRKMAFEPIVIPLSVTATGLMNLMTTLGAALIFALANGVYPTLMWLQLIPIVLLLAIFATGIGMLLSSLYVRYRDVFPIWEVMSQILFYASAVLYVVDPTVPDKYQQALLYNPIASLTTQMRHAVIDSDAPTTVSLIGGYAELLIPLGIIAGAFVAGAFVFRRASPRIAENL